MPTSAATGTQSVKAGGAKSQKVAPGHEAKASQKAEAKAAGQSANAKDNPDQPDRVDTVRAATPAAKGETDGFHRTRSYQKDDGTNVIQELRGKQWVNVEERPRTNG